MKKYRKLDLDLVIQLYYKLDGNCSLVAKKLKYHRSYINYVLKKHDIKGNGNNFSNRSKTKSHYNKKQLITLYWECNQNYSHIAKKLNKRYGVIYANFKRFNILNDYPSKAREQYNNKRKG